MKNSIVLFLFLHFAFFVSAQENIVTSINTDSTIITRAEIMPSFPGGSPALMKYLSENIKYPPKAVENGLEGKVFVKFYIDIDGTAQNPVVIKDNVGGGCAEEALKVIKNMPKWSPGMQKGEPVKVYYILSVTFKLPDESTNNADSKAMFVGGDYALEEYKKSIIKKCKKNKADKNKSLYIEVSFIVTEKGNVMYATILEANTNDEKIKKTIIDNINNMPLWKPEVKEGRAVLSLQTLIFTF